MIEAKTIRITAQNGSFIFPDGSVHLALIAPSGIAVCSVYMEPDVHVRTYSKDQYEIVHPTKIGEGLPNTYGLMPGESMAKLGDLFGGNIAEIAVKFK